MIWRSLWTMDSYRISLFEFFSRSFSGSKRAVSHDIFSSGSLIFKVDLSNGIQYYLEQSYESFISLYYSLKKHPGFSVWFLIFLFYFPHHPLISFDWSTLVAYTIHCPHDEISKVLINKTGQSLKEVIQSFLDAAWKVLPHPSKLTQYFYLDVNVPHHLSDGEQSKYAPSSNNAVYFWNLLQSYFVVL